MTFQEAVKACEAGKQVRREDWEEGEIMCLLNAMDKRNDKKAPFLFVVNGKDHTPYTTTKEDHEATDWEEVGKKAA